MRRFVDSIQALIQFVNLSKSEFLIFLAVRLYENRIITSQSGPRKAGRMRNHLRPRLFFQAMQPLTGTAGALARLLGMPLCPA
jgi:hypothetical protein